MNFAFRVTDLHLTWDDLDDELGEACISNDDQEGEGPEITRVIQKGGKGSKGSQGLHSMGDGIKRDGHAIKGQRDMPAFLLKTTANS